MSKSFLDASIPGLVQQLKVDEKIALLGAPNWWNTTSVPRLGIPSVRMSDGPNVRHSENLMKLKVELIRVYRASEGLPISSQRQPSACQ